MESQFIGNWGPKFRVPFRGPKNPRSRSLVTVISILRKNVGEECRFEHEAPPAEHEEPKRGGRGSNLTQPSPSQNTSKGSRYAQAAEDDWSEDEDDKQELIRLRKENAELRGRWLVLCSPCSNDNPIPAATGRVVRVLKTKVHSRGPSQTARPVVNPTKPLG